MFLLSDKPRICIVCMFKNREVNMLDRYEKLDDADRWLFDMLKLSEPAGFFVMEDVDMTATQEIIAQLRQQGIKGSYTHIIVRATALAFTRHPELNRLIL